MSPVPLKSKREDDEALLEEYDEVDDTAEVDTEDEIEGEDGAFVAVPPTINRTVIRQAAISDSRRRRLLARGVDPDLAPTSVTEVVATPSKGRPTPSMRDAGRVEPNRNPVARGVGGIFARLAEYFRNVRGELNRVTWLPRPELLRLSYIVLGVTAITAVFLGIVSYVFESLNIAIATTGSLIASIVVIGLILGVAIVWLIRDRLFPESQ